jgi:hypothetical protein
MQIRILEDTELKITKKRGHRAPSRTRKHRYVKRYLQVKNSKTFIRIELDEDLDKM